MCFVPQGEGKTVSACTSAPHESDEVAMARFANRESLNSCKQNMHTLRRGKRRGRRNAAVKVESGDDSYDVNRDELYGVMMMTSSGSMPILVCL
jgi:hypothetical protein